MYAFIILSTAVTISSNIQEFIAFAAVLLIVTAIMLRLYLPAATQVKGLRATSAGALVGLSAEVLEGLKVVQAYSHQQHFVKVRFAWPPHLSGACSARALLVRGRRCRVVGLRHLR